MEEVKKMMKSSIAKAMGGSFFLLVVPALLVLLIISLVSMWMTKTQLEERYGNSISILSDQMNNFLSDVQVQSGAFLLDMELLELVNEGQENMDLYRMVQFQERLKLYTQLRFAEVNVQIVLPKQGWVLSSVSGIGKTGEYPLLEEGGLENQSVWGIHPGMKEPLDTKFSLVLGYVSRTQTTPFAVLEIDRQELLKRIRQYFDSPEVKGFILLDYQGEAYYTELDSPLAGQVAESAKEKLADQSASEWGNAVAFPVQDGGREYTGVFASVESAGAMVGVVFDSGEILLPIKKLIMGLTAGLLCFVGAAAGFAVISYRRFLSPVMTLTEAMRKVKKGDFNVRVTIPEDNDLSLIANQFNAMVERIHRMIEEEYQMKIRLQDAKLKFLKSQINPHFLYNSLFSLYNMIESGELEQASDMAVYLGKYYQQSAHLEDSELSLGEELENIRLYLKIFQMRFPGALVYKEEVCREMMEMKIPILSIQTLVENAVTHGFRKARREGTLSIYGYFVQERVCIEVRDDGEGIEKEKMEELLRSLNGGESGLEGHGIENVYQRMRGMYPSAVIEIEALSRGTAARILIDRADIMRRGERDVSAAIGG